MPALTDSESWEQPLQEETLQETVTQIALLVEPDVSEKRINALSLFLRRQDYTDAEIRYAAGELPKDKHLDNKMRYGKPLTPADFERVIDKIRKTRKVLTQKRIPENKVGDLVEEIDELKREDFGQMGFDGKDNPVYTVKSKARERIQS